MADEMPCICQYDGYVENKDGEIEYVGGAKSFLRSIQKNMVFSQFVQRMGEVSSNKENETFILIKHIVSGVTCNVDNNSDYQAMFSLFRNNPQHPPRNVPAARNFFRIQPYSSLSKNLIEKYDSSEFESGGYKWKLCFYPNGDKKGGVTDHISLYLVMLDMASLPVGWEVDAVYRFFLYNHLEKKYVVVEGPSDWKFKRFNKSKTEWGFSYLIPLATFNDPSNGYLVDDTCKFGAEVFVSKWSANSNRLTVIKDDNTSGKFKWNVELSKVSSSSNLNSDEFLAEGCKWQMLIWLTRSSPAQMGFLLNLKSVPEKKFHATTLLRLRNQKTNKHFECEGPPLGDQNFWGKTDFIEWDVLKNVANGFVVDGKFVLEAEITVLG